MQDGLKCEARSGLVLFLLHARRGLLMDTPIDESQVRHVARLARLKLSDDEIRQHTVSPVPIRLLLRIILACRERTLVD